MTGAAVLDFLINIDITLLKFLNTSLSNRLFDVVMPVITSLDFWRLPLILTLVGIALLGGRYGLITVILGVILLTITDQLSSHFLKGFFGRVRPCHELTDIRVLTGCGNTRAFPSSHATNTMAAALFFGYRYRRILPELVGLSLLVSYSRVYIGIHYPGDLLAGWIVGAGCAFAVLVAYNRLQRRWPLIESTRRSAWVGKVFRRRTH